MNEAVLSNIVGKLYDAALEPALWDGVIDEARDFIGGSAAAIYSRDVTGASFAVHHEDQRLDPHYTRLYVEEYAKLDPMTAGQSMSTVDNPFASTDIIDFDELCASRHYQEWIRPQGFVDFINVAMEKSPRRVLLFGVFRHERDGIVDDGTRWRMRLLAPHLKRASLVGASFAAKGEEHAALTDTLDGLSTALFLTRAGGQIVHANAAAWEMLASSGVVRAAAGNLTARKPAANRELALALAATAEGDNALGRRAAALPLSSDAGDSYVAHVMPLTSGTRRQTGHSYGATAAVFIRKVAVSAGATPETIARFYGLTPSELRVLLAIVDVGGVPEVADALGVSAATAKTHLKRVYSKTGATRQADLVKLVAGFASPLHS